MPPTSAKKQKLNWLKYRDENTKLFHKRIKNRRKWNIVRALTIDGNIVTEQGKIQDVFLQHFKGIMCGKLENRLRINMEIISEGPILNDYHRNALNLQFTPDEI